MNVMTDSTKSDLCEDLANLYLRLNGFFTSDFVVHAPSGQGNTAEIDILAVRFPLHREPEREFEVKGDPFLKLSENHIEFAVCEVKGGNPKIQCNPSLRNSPDGISRVLRWLGMFDDNEIQRLVPKVMKALQPRTVQTPEEIVTIDAKEKLRIRFYFFAPDLDKPRRNQSFFIGGPTIINFIWRCVSVGNKRAACATNYGAGQWGRIAPLVRFFKQWPSERTPEIQDFYSDDRLARFYAEIR